MSKSDSDSEQSYCSDDSEFNYIPSPYVIEAVKDEEANANEAAASPTDDTLDPDTSNPTRTRTSQLRVKSGFVSMRKDKKPRQSLKGSLRIVMKEYNL